MINLQKVRAEKLHYYLVVLVCVFEYFIISTIIYYLSLYSGRNGVSIPIFGGGDDGILYYSQISDIFNNGMIDSIQYTSSYAPVMGYLVKLIGILDPFIIRLMNLVGLILLLWEINRLVSVVSFDAELSVVKRQQLQNQTVLWLTIYPSLVMMVTLSIYRDIWIYVFFIGAIVELVKWTIKQGFSSIICLCIYLILLFKLRPYACVSIIVGYPLFLFIKTMNQKRLILYSTMLIIILIIWYSFFKDFKFPLIHMSLTSALEYREGNLAQQFNVGASDIHVKLGQSNVFFFIGAYLYSFITNLAGPFIWQTNSVQTIMVCISESLVIMIVVIYCVKWITHHKYLNQACLLLFSESFFWIGLISITNKNIGTGTRLRVPAFIMMLIIFLCLRLKEKQEGD